MSLVTGTHRLRITEGDGIGPPVIDTTTPEFVTTNSLRNLHHQQVHCLHYISLPMLPHARMAHALIMTILFD